MTNKKDCKIIQDLLPNYIEKLTSEETNSYIEEHLRICAECKTVLGEMQKDFVVDKKSDIQEIDYIKKFSEKMKIFKVIIAIFIFILLVCIAFTTSKFLILQSLSIKMGKTLNLDNYHLKVEYYNSNPKDPNTPNIESSKTGITETYYKDGNFISTHSVCFENTGMRSFTSYKSQGESFLLLDSPNSKSLIYTPNVFPTPGCPPPYSILQNLYLSISADINVITFGNKAYYAIGYNGLQQYYDYDTGLHVKSIGGISEAYDYYYEFNNVTDDDIIRPDTTGADVSYETE